MEKDIVARRVVCGSISVYKHTHERQMHISSKSDFFNEEVIIKIENDKIIFRKPSIGYNGKSRKFSRHKSGYYHTAIVCELPIGKYEFDEDESDEDCMVAYYRQ